MISKINLSQMCDNIFEEEKYLFFLQGFSENMYILDFGISCSNTPLEKFNELGQNIKGTVVTLLSLFFMSCYPTSRRRKNKREKMEWAQLHLHLCFQANLNKCLYGHLARRGSQVIHGKLACCTSMTSFQRTSISTHCRPVLV